MPKQMKTAAQNKAIFGLGAKLNCGHDDLQELAHDVTNGRTSHISKLTFDEANAMIVRLGGRAFAPFFGSRRTANYHKQKAGIETIVSQAHLDKLQRLADGRGMTNEGLQKLCQRIFKADKPRTSKECNQAIEAIKAMNKRDRIFKGFNKKEAA